MIAAVFRLEVVIKNEKSDNGSWLKTTALHFYFVSYYYYTRTSKNDKLLFYPAQLDEVVYIPSSLNELLPHGRTVGVQKEGGRLFLFLCHSILSSDQSCRPYMDTPLFFFSSVPLCSLSDITPPGGDTRGHLATSGNTVVNLCLLNAGVWPSAAAEANHHQTSPDLWEVCLKVKQRN